MRFHSAGSRISGLVAPLSSLRSEGSPACGEFPDLALLGELAASWGLSLVQLLPVNDSGSQSSPYSALSAFALHPLYLRIAELPEALLPEAKPALAAARTLAARHAGDRRLRYGPYLEGKLAALESLFRAVYAEGGPGADPELPLLDEEPEFEPWLKANAWVKAYAVFSELKRRNGGKPWWEWTEYRDPRPGLVEELWASSELAFGTRFRAWLQFRADGQFSRAAQALAERGVELMGDLPILVGEDSAEVWARRDCFRRELKAGAPPDMYAALGQNWGCPVYDWEALAKEDYAFWRERLALAERYYSAYRIDHVLGFFRIWTLGARQSSGYLGRFLPDAAIERGELAARGFSAERIRWLSEPHLPGGRLLEAAGGDATAAMEAQRVLLDRIGNEELFLFKREIRGERDIEEASSRGLPGWGESGLDPRLRDYLLGAYRDRVLFEFEPGRFVPAWSWRGASAWMSLSEAERAGLETLFAEKRKAGEAVWEENGRQILRLLKASSTMLPCAEDLGAVPPCVPRVLGELGILGLRVLRWARKWEEPGQPFVPPKEYPELTVACLSVHDSSSLRAWWEEEAERPLVWSLAEAALGEELGPAPERLEPEGTRILSRALAAGTSAIAVYPIQDLLALSSALREPDPRAERINIPGAVDDWNWGWRLPSPLERIAGEPGFGELVRSATARDASGKGVSRPPSSPGARKSAG